MGCLIMLRARGISGPMFQKCGSKLIKGVGNFNRYTSPPPVIEDPYWDDVSLHLPMDTDFIDVSSPSLIPSITGDPVINPAEGYGPGAGDFDGNDYISYSGAPAPGLGDFTAQIRVRFNAASGDGTIFTLGSIGGEYYSILRISGFIRVWSNSHLITGPALSNETWAHIALTRTAGVTELFMEGVSAGTTITNRNLSSLIVVGGPTSGGVIPVNGLLDDFQFTNGINRYPMDFTPPTGPLPVG